MKIFNSKSDFFKQTKITLAIKHNEVTELLKFKGLSDNLFLEAYDYFVNHPKQFDGATIVKDLHDIKGLDLSALIHDYRYVCWLAEIQRLKMA